MESKGDELSDGDSSGFRSDNENDDDLTPPFSNHATPGSPNKNINSLLSDNSEIEIDFRDGDDGLNSSSSPLRLSEHHIYQEEQRYLFEQGNISDSGLEEDDDEDDEEEKEQENQDNENDSNNFTGQNDQYECERYLSDEGGTHDTGHTSDHSTKSSHSAASAAYDANLRKLLEATIVDVIVAAGMEMLSTPVKNKIDRHVSNKSASSNQDDDHVDKVLFTNSVLKKMCRAVAIELSLELRAPSSNMDSESNQNSTDESKSVDINTSMSSEMSLSPSARDIEQMIWPVFASFLNAEESDEMVILLVDSLSSLIFDNTLQPLYSSMPDIQGVRTMSEDFDGTNDEQSSRSMEEVVDTSLTSLAEVRAAAPISHRSRLSPQNSQEFLRGETTPVLKSGSQNSLVNQYIDEIRHHETEHQRHLLDSSDDDNDHHTPSNRRSYSIAATVDSCEMEDLRRQDNIQDDHRRKNPDESDTIDDENDPSAPWNIPNSPMDDVFRQTHNALGSPYRLPVDISSYSQSKKYSQPFQYNNKKSDDDDDDDDNNDDHSGEEKDSDAQDRGDEDFNDDVNSPSPMDDLFRRTHNSFGSPYRLPIGLNEQDQHEDNDHHDHHEDEEFYDEDDYAHNLFGSGGYVPHSPERHTPTERSIATTDALAGMSVVSHGGMSSQTSSSSSSSSSSSAEEDTVSSPLTHDNYNSSPRKEEYRHHYRHDSGDLSNLDIDEESSTNSLSMHNFAGDHEYFERRGGGAISVSNTSLSSPSISTRRSDAITISDLPDNFGGDFFATDNDSLDRMSGSEDNDNNANGFDCDEPTPSTDGQQNHEQNVLQPLSVTNLSTHYSSYEITMLDHLDKIANSPTSGPAGTTGPQLTRTQSLSSSQCEEDVIMLESEDNLIRIPNGEGSPLSNHPMKMFGQDMDHTSNDNEESESSLYEESDTSSSDDDDANDDNEDDEDNSQQQSLLTDAAVVGMHGDDEHLHERDYNLYGLNISSASTGQKQSSNSRVRDKHGNRNNEDDNDIGDSDFSDQIPLPGESYESFHHEHPISRHSQYVKSPAELHVSPQLHPRSGGSDLASSGSFRIPSAIDSPIKDEGVESGDSSPHSIYSSRLAQNIPLTSFSQVLYNNHKTASQSYSDNTEDSSDDENDDDDNFISPPQYNEYSKHQDYSSSGNGSSEELLFTSTTSITTSSNRNKNGNESLDIDEEAAEDIRLFNDIVSSMNTIDPNDETAQTNAYFMAELMKSTLDENAMSFFKGTVPRDDRNKLTNNSFFDDNEFLNMEAVSHKLDNILLSTGQREEEDISKRSKTSQPQFDKFGLQVSFENALTPEEYDTSTTSSLSMSKGAENGRVQPKNVTVTEDILMTGEATNRSNRYLYNERHNDDDDNEQENDNVHDFERSSSDIRIDAIRQFGDMVKRYATPTDQSPLNNKKKNNTNQDKDFFPVVSDDKVQYDKDLYDSVRQSTTNDFHENQDNNNVQDYQQQDHQDYHMFDVRLHSQQAYNANRPTSAKGTPKVSLRGTTPSSSQRKSQIPDHQSPEPSSLSKSRGNIGKNTSNHVPSNSSSPPPPPSSSSPSSSSKKTIKKQSSSSAAVNEKSSTTSNTLTNGKIKITTKMNSSPPPKSHIVVIPPVPVIDEDFNGDVYAGSRDVYADPSHHHKFGVDFTTASNKHVLPGGNPPPAFSPTSPRKAASAIQFSKSQANGSSNHQSQHRAQQQQQQHAVPSSQQHTFSSNTERKTRPKSAPRSRTPSKPTTITPNSATAAMAAQRAAKDPASLLRKSTSALPTGSGKRMTSRSSSRGSANKRMGTISRSLDDSHIRYHNHNESDVPHSVPSKQSTRMSSRQQAKKMQHLAAPTFSSAVRTLDIAGVDIATVQAMAAAGPVGAVGQLSISSGGMKKNKSRK